MAASFYTGGRAGVLQASARVGRAAAPRPPVAVSSGERLRILHAAFCIAGSGPGSHSGDIQRNGVGQSEFAGVVAHVSVVKAGAQHALVGLEVSIGREQGTSMPMTRLDRDVVLVWLVPLPTDESRGQVETEDALGLLDGHERRAALRFVHDRDRARYVAAHRALRRILAFYLGISAADVRIERANGQKPRLAPGPQSDLTFNLSHATDLALVAVSRSREIGVDVEGLAGFAWDASFAARCFPESTVARLLRLRGADRETRFLRMWTRCEAVLKARGTGLDVLPFAEDVLHPRDVRVVQLEPDAGHVAAVAGEGQWRLEIRRMTA